MGANTAVNDRPDYDQVLQDIADYTLHFTIESAEAWLIARYCLMDALACGLLALQFPECTKQLGPIVDGTVVPNGARVPGTSFQLDPVKAAWDIGCMIRWLDYNDTWLAAEWGHPSDNLGGILAVADYLSQQQVAEGKPSLTMRDVLASMIIAYEIQGCLALHNAFNRVGLDHTVLVKVASTAAVAKLRGASRRQLLSALSHAWVDGHSLRTYRQAPNVSSRKSWAAADATARAVRLVDIALRGEAGIPSVLTAPQWGFYDVLFAHTNRDLQLKPEHERVFKCPQPYGTYVMENILFKVAFPAEFHAQTACEACMILHPQAKDRLNDIVRIELTTHEAAIRIISKQGPLANAADRDHCLQYMAAVSLLFGRLTADDYTDHFHQQQPAIDNLRDKMVVIEDQQYNQAYHDPDKRAIANAVQVFFNDGSSTNKVAIYYPIGHRRRRQEALPLLAQKFKNHLATRLPAARCDALFALCSDQKKLESTAVNTFVATFAI